jgi:hypothetical protein
MKSFRIYLPISAFIASFEEGKHATVTNFTIPISVLCSLHSISARFAPIRTQFSTYECFPYSHHHYHANGPSTRLRNTTKLESIHSPVKYILLCSILDRLTGICTFRPDPTDKQIYPLLGEQNSDKIHVTGQNLRPITNAHTPEYITYTSRAHVK